MTRRVVERLARQRAEMSHAVHPGATVVVGEPRGDLRWWTWAGYRTNATLAATFGEVADPIGRFTDTSIRLRENTTPVELRAALSGAAGRLCLPDVQEKAVSGLKFGAALSPRLATATLAARLADLDGAAAICGEPVRFVVTRACGGSEAMQRCNHVIK